MASLALTRTDLARMLDLIRDMNAAPDNGFLRTVLARTAGLVPADTVSYNEQDAGAASEELFVIEPDYAERIRRDTAYLTNLGEHPAFVPISNGALPVGQSVSISDLVDARTFRQLPIYQEYYRQREVEDQLVTLISADRSRTRTRLLVLSRSRRGFTTRDRAAIELLVPHLRHALRHRQRVARLSAAAGRLDTVTIAEPSWSQLTPRELDVVGFVSSGATDAQIGRLLGISGRTVGKHLENVYRKLSVPGRPALVAAVVANRSAS